jgi:hypothetical protein
MHLIRYAPGEYRSDALVDQQVNNRTKSTAYRDNIEIVLTMYGIPMAGRKA